MKPLLVLCVAILWFAGCTHRPVPETTATASSIPLEGVTWQLMRFGDHALKVPRKAWIKLDRGRYTGFAGCNGLGGTYTREGDRIAFSMDPHTMMACPDMKGETEFRRRLSKVDSYGMNGGMLVLKSGDRPVLEFMAKE